MIPRPPTRFAFLLFCSLSVWLTACSHTPPKTTPPAAAAVASPAPPPPKPFEAGTLYSLLTAEIAGQRQKPDILLSNYVQQAERTRDPQILAHAALIARQLKQRATALHISELWVATTPTNLQARQSLMIELALANRPEDAFKQGEFLLANQTDSGLDKLAAQVVQAEQDPALQPNAKTQSAALLPRYQHLLQSHPNQFELLLGTSYLQAQQGDSSTALNLANRAHALKPQDPFALHQQARLLQALNQPREALAKIAQILTLQSQNQALRLEYAKSLAREDAAAAELQFQHLLAQNPKNPELTLSLALVQLEQKKWALAQPYLAELVSHPRYGNTAHLYAGRAALQLQQWQDALTHLRQVSPGPEFLAAQQELAQLLVTQGQAPAALQHLRQQAQHALPAQSQGFVLLEAKLLTLQKAHNEAEALLSQHLQHTQHPIPLLYARSLLYSDTHQQDKANADLRQLLQLDPNNSIALNALGYGLSQDPTQLDEALSLVQKALSLNPQEPAIMDSLGWVYFRQGKLKQALHWLKAAHDRWPDPEVAAHYGEVLWRQGRKKAARTVWQAAWQKSPQHPALTQTLQRHSIQLD